MQSGLKFKVSTALLGSGSGFMLGVRIRCETTAAACQSCTVRGHREGGRYDQDIDRRGGEQQSRTIQFKDCAAGRLSDRRLT